jgi:DNA-binding GntR family transcriptional regulator
MRSQTVASLKTAGRLKNTVAEHRAMLESMKAGDITNSYMNTLNHIGQAKQLIELD